MTRLRAGFTLIELLIVVVIIGILAAVALPKFSQARKRAMFTTLASDLTNLRQEQELYYQSGTGFAYASTVTALAFTPTTGVNIAITGADNFAWAATATHDALAATEGCAIWFGDNRGGAPTITYPSTPGGTTLDATTEDLAICDG